MGTNTFKRDTCIRFRFSESNIPGCSRGCSQGCSQGCFANYSKPEPIIPSPASSRPAPSDFPSARPQIQPFPSFPHLQAQVWCIDAGQGVMVSAIVISAVGRSPTIPPTPGEWWRARQDHFRRRPQRTDHCQRPFIELKKMSGGLP